MVSRVAGLRLSEDLATRFFFLQYGKFVTFTKGDLRVSKLD